MTYRAVKKGLGLDPRRGTRGDGRAAAREGLAPHAPEPLLDCEVSL